MKTFDPASNHVLSEILGIGFRAYPRNLINGVVFGMLAAWFLRDMLPHFFLASWLARSSIGSQACRRWASMKCGKRRASARMPATAVTATVPAFAPDEVVTTVPRAIIRVRIGRSAPAECV